MNASATQSPDSLGSLSGSAFVEQARKNVAKWGKQDLETLGLVIAEETGELCQAILKARWEGGDRERIRQEAIDLGALCHQVIFHLDHPPCAACDSGDYQLGHSDHCPKSDPVFIGARARLERHFESKQNTNALVQPRLVRLAWSPPAPPCEECRYDHTRAETPFGPFLLTWKGWKDYDSPGFDETPWGEVEYHGWNSVEEAQAWADSEMERRINECLANTKS